MAARGGAGDLERGARSNGMAFMNDPRMKYGDIGIGGGGME